MKVTLTTLLFLLLGSLAFSQVGINTSTPDVSSILDIQSADKGVLISRVTNASDVITPASGLLVFDTTKNCLSQNTGTPAAPNWVCMSPNVLKFFYMPSIVIDTSKAEADKELNLYDEYKKQFATPAVVSTNAPTDIPYFLNSSDLYYYVTYYDTSVLNVHGIDDSGLMTYDVLGGATPYSYMNIVFVVK